MRALLALVSAAVVLALGAEAAQAGMTLKVDIWGAGKVELPSEGFMCTSTNRNDRELGTSCTLTTDLLIAALTATPDASQPVTWRFSNWQGDCSPSQARPRTSAPSGGRRSVIPPETSRPSSTTIAHRP